jgi:hypothetical protein
MLQAEARIQENKDKAGSALITFYATPPEITFLQESIGSTFLRITLKAGLGIAR